MAHSPGKRLGTALPADRGADDVTLHAYYSRHAARWATICRHYDRGRRDYWAIVDGHVRPVVVTKIDPRGYAKITGRRTRVAACHLFMSRDKAIVANSTPRRRHDSQ